MVLLCLCRGTINDGGVEVIVKTTWKNELTFQVAVTEGTFMGNLTDWKQLPSVYSLSVCEDDEMIFLVMQ